MRRVGAYLLLALGGLVVSYLPSLAAPVDKTHQQEVQAALRSAPLAFERNGGAADTNAGYVMHEFGIGAGFASNAVSFLLPVETHRATRMGMSFGGRSAQIVGEQELPGKTNYFRGNNSANWRTGLANFAQIRYRHLWPGIDLVFYGNGEHLEHDFVVEPGAAAKQIAFDIDGAQKIELLSSGDLVIHVGGGEVNFKKPVAYQQTGAGRKQVAAGFRLNGNRVSFQLGRYDHHRTLTIDPVLVFSTLLVGSAFDEITGMTLDAQGNIYVVGETLSADFPVTASAEQPACNACGGNAADAFVTKLNPTGTALVYSTFLGGTGQDSAHSVVVDSNGNAIVSGNTLSADFPSLHPIGTFTTSNNWHMFVASLSATGSTLNYSGIVGPLNVVSSSSGTTFIPSSTFVPLAVDSSGNAYATVQTVFPAFPTTPSAIAPVPPNPQAAALMALKISPTGSLVYSTAIPGRATPAPPGNFGAPGPNNFSQSAIAVDSTGSAYIAGQANDGLPTNLGVIGPAFVSDSGFFVFGPQEGFLLKLNPAGSALTYATYIPGSSMVSALRVDGSGNAYLGGVTSSPSLPVSANGFQKDPGCAGCRAAYLLKLNPQATASLAGTYLRGTPRAINDPAGLAHIALDGSGNIYATGGEGTGNFPMKNPLIQPRGGFVIELSNDLSTLLFSSGGPDALIEIGPSGRVILASNSGFPPTPGAFQTTVPPTRGDLFVLPNIAVIDLTVAAPAVCCTPVSLNFSSGVVAPGGTSAPQSATVTNCGNADLHISSIASDSPNYGVTTNCALAPAGIAPGSSCTVSATYSPVNYQTGNIVITNDALLSPHDINLFGSPKAPFTFISPSSLTFLETPVTTTIGLPIQIANTGFTDLTVSALSTTGDFSVTQNCVGAVLAPPTPSPLGPLLHFCNSSVFFSPTNTGTRTGTLIVKDTSLDSPHTVQLSGLGITAWPTPILNNGLSVNVAATGGGVAGSIGSAQTLFLTGGGFSRVTTATLDGLIFDNNIRQMKIVSPQEIDLTLADQDFGDAGEVPVQVVTPTPGGGTSNTVATITSPIKFYNFTARQIEFVLSGSMVVGPKSGLIYDAVGGAFLEAPNIPVPSVAVIDPVQERLISGLVNFPNIATVLAISDDEQFLYAALPGNNTVAQISLPSGTINFMASLGKDAALGNYNATSIRVMPGHPHTWVAALQPVLDTKPIALKVFDDAVPRANAVEHGNATSTFPGKLLFVGNDTTTVYSIDSTSLYRFTIDANGVTLKDKTTGLGAEDFATDGSLLYLSTGAIIDPGTLLNKGNFALAPGLPVHAVEVDGATSRAIFAGDATPTFGNGSLVQGFDTSTLAVKGSFTMPKLSGVTSVRRWGTNGLAFGIFSGAVTVTRSSLTGNSGLLAPFHIGSNFGQGPIGTAQISAGQNATYALGIVGVNGFNGPVTLSCSNLPQFASCNFSQNPVTPGGTVVVTISTHQAATASAAPTGLYMRSGSGFILVTALLTLPFGLAFVGRRYRGKLLGLCLLIFMMGCGGGGGGQGGGSTPAPAPSATPTGSNTPIGTYDVILTGTSSSGTRHVVLQMIVLS